MTNSNQKISVAYIFVGLSMPADIALEFLSMYVTAHPLRLRLFLEYCEKQFSE